MRLIHYKNVHQHQLKNKIDKIRWIEIDKTESHRVESNEIESNGGEEKDSSGIGFD